MCETLIPWPVSLFLYFYKLHLSFCELNDSRKKTAQSKDREFSAEKFHASAANYSRPKKKLKLE